MTIPEGGCPSDVPVWAWNGVRGAARMAWWFKLAENVGVILDEKFKVGVGPRVRITDGGAGDIGSAADEIGIVFVWEAA